MDDLPQLVELWKLENLPWHELEKHLTEFQVADDGAGKILGAIGFQIAANQGKVHNEAFFRPDLSDTIREKFWERVQTLSHNHALLRIWTLETAPFWHGYGFHAPPPEAMSKLPSVFGSAELPWTVLQLRAEPVAPVIDIDKEFEVFRESERARTEQAFRQARTLKAVATILAALLFLGVLFGMAYLVFKDQSPP